VLPKEKEVRKYKEGDRKIFMLNMLGEVGVLQVDCTDDSLYCPILQPRLSWEE
jgi:hypothetical protein